MNDTYKMGSPISQWMPTENLTVTFILTQNCNLKCKYCYQVNKNNSNRMTFDVAKKAIDYILANPNIFVHKAVTWDFIGGEPLLEIDLMDKITDYIKMKTFSENHKWFSLNRINISSNGILYNTEGFQKYLHKNKEKCGIGITIDGIKEKHDLQRVYPDGSGSYDDVAKNVSLWVKQVDNPQTKVTIGSDDLQYLKDSIIHLWKLGIKTVPANVVFENVWKEGDDILFENQLKELADYIVDNKLWDKYNTTLFSDRLGGPFSEEKLNENSCGSGFMLAVDAQGNFYPCLRYAGFSLEHNSPYIIGNVEDGLDFDKLRPFLGVNAQNINDEECLECDIATGCSWCQGQCYDSSENKTNYYRDKSICKMHKARFRANEYFWGRLREEFNISREINNIRSKNLFFIMDDNCVEHCNYNSRCKDNVMPDEILKAGIEFCEKNIYKPVILHSKNSLNIKNINDISYIDRYEIYNNGLQLCDNNSTKIQVVTPQTIESTIKTDICILNLKENEIEDMYLCAKKIFKSCDRINLNIQNYTYSFDLELYKEQLSKILELIKEYHLKEERKEFNKISDTAYLNKLDGCNSGYKSFALAPNGKIYICPKFYFNDETSYIGDIKNGIQLKGKELFKPINSPFCKECDVYHCDCCVYMNKKLTNEYNIPSALQCRISHVEREIANKFISLVKKEKKIPKENTKTCRQPVEKIFNRIATNAYDIDAFL
ncbi:radical SAM domain-containing protein [Clostridium botulinum B str. Osaka05]|uniref:Radical SAM domain-containing protein n=1 Tax=Clostridium botulinum B str. Osaka05 TaxID=1407017 RepID=A0A0S6U0Z8_CLOBO|nr:radical SAM peptide maturase, CXXX-repeat target family [Clostridium botulinum]GAE00762.1 radical SAM domain-containing protein [Clostridium botulinum B str. Osaka05]